MEFRSQLETLMPAKELAFQATPGFGKFRRFLSQAMPHPAKMNTNLLKFLIDHFTKPGDVVLDPMCGSGSTGIVAALRGRHALQVDIEKRFIEWADQAKENVRAQQTLTPKGHIVNICADSRKLELAGYLDAIITSPPYSDSRLQNWAASNKAMLEFEKKLRETFRKNGFVEYQGRKYSEEEWRQINKGELKPRGMPELWAQILRGYIDAVITSPPYAHQTGAAKPTRGERQGTFRMGHSKQQPYTDENYRPWDNREGGNIGKSEYFIRVPCSEEEATFHDARSDRVGTKWEFIKELEPTVQKLRTHQRTKDAKKGRAETYSQAMLKVYAEMHRLLKPGGPAAIVIKPFIRNKRVIDLPMHTWKLLEHVGFRLEALYKLRLTHLSFWRRLLHQKFPELPELRHEYVLVVRK